MSYMVRAWLDHTHKLDNEATPGPWSFIPDVKVTGEPVLRGGSDETGGDVFACPRYTHREFTADAEWIAHTRTALPAATAALRAVLDQHQQADYQRHVPRMLRRTPEDHLPYRPCDGCREEWPCPTVKAITAALTSHQHPTPPGSSGKCNHTQRGITWAEQGTTAYACNTCEHEWTETN